MKLSLLQRVLLFIIIVNVGFIGFQLWRSMIQNDQNVISINEFNDDIFPFEGELLEAVIIMDHKMTRNDSLRYKKLYVNYCLSNKIIDHPEERLLKEEVLQWMNECLEEKLFE